MVSVRWGEGLGVWESVGEALGWPDRVWVGVGVGEAGLRVVDGAADALRVREGLPEGDRLRVAALD